MRRIVRQEKANEIKKRRCIRLVKPAMTYGMEAVPVKKNNESRMEIAEMRMLRWMYGVTTQDKKVYKDQRSSEDGGGFVMKRDREGDEKRALDSEVQGRKRRGRLRTR